MKIFLLLASLTILASCTLGTPASPVMEKNTMKMDKSMSGMKDSSMKMDEKMMSGTWTPEEMAKMQMTKSMSGMKDSSMKMDDKMMMTGSAMKQESMKMDDMKWDTMRPTGYAGYDEASVKWALASGQKVVLFFHAPWCPTCKSLDSAIRSDLISIPADTLIVKVDYDTSEMLKKKYGVTVQHTTVMIDKDMALISKKLGARSVAEVLN